MRIVSDDRPADVLDALDARVAGPVAVVDHRRRVPPDLPARLRRVPGDTWLVAFTSGSTDLPRGVCRTYDSWQAGVAAFAEVTATAAGSTVLVPGPLSSTLFLHAAWHARQVGAEALLAPLDTEKPWDVVHLVPAQLRRLLAADSDVAGRTAVVAGAALDRATAEQARGRGMRVLAYYGAAELSFVALDTGTGLRAFPGADVQARDGVLWVRSPYVATGYLPDSTGGPVAGGAMRRDADWATVGDRGSVGDDGRVTVDGRGEAAVQTGGVTVWVADVEQVLRQAPGVRDVVVLSVSNVQLGQVVGAAVESDGDVADLRAWARRRLDASALPRRWAVVPALPRTRAGKVDRAAAIVLLAAGATAP